ncbi:MAG TPA: T9SS type A sorting domain-containing protein [Candidatus Eisenbacteria bacterium]|jgi:hypothetical protein
MPPTVPPWIRSASVLLALSIAAPRPAFADWPASPTVNVPVCTASDQQLTPAITTDAVGGAIIAWSDSRAGSANTDIYVQRVLASGSVDPAWPVNGRAICTAPGAQFNVRIVSDGAGGAVLCWQDGRGGTTFDVYAQHVLPGGGVDPAWPVDGRAISTAAGNQFSIAMIPDDAGGAIMAWRDFRAGSASDVYAGHVLAGGQVDPVWPVDGRALCTQPDTTAHPRGPCLVSDGQGGAIVAWSDFRDDASFDIYAQRVRSNGSLDPAWPADGRALCTAIGDQQRPDIVSDGAGGAIVGWDDLRGGATSDIYAQHVGPTGAVDAAWPLDGRLVCSAVGNQVLPRLAQDGTGGASITWLDNRSGTTGQDVYADHVLASGDIDPGWPLDGRAVCGAFGAQTNPAVAADGAGGVFVTWQDPRNINYDIYLQHVLATGDVDPGWPLDGRAVCTAPAAQQVPAILADGSGGAIVTWFDGRPGATNDIYAQRVQSNGQLGGTVVGVPRDGRSTLALDPVQPNPWRGGVLTLSFTLPTGSPATLEVIDVAGRRVAVQTFGSPGPGRQSVRLRPGAHVAPGIYLVQLRQGAVTSPRRLVALE